MPGAFDGQGGEEARGGKVSPARPWRRWQGGWRCVMWFQACVLLVLILAFGLEVAFLAR